MIAQWMGYSLAVTILVAAGALALEVALQSRDFPVRRIWMLALFGSTCSIVIPLLAGRTVTPTVAGEVVEPNDPGGAARYVGGSSAEPDWSSRLPDSVHQGSDSVLGWTWILASGAGLLALHLNLANQRRQRRRWRRAVIDGVPLLVSRNVGPAVTGVVHPEIVVPEWILALPDDSRSIVIAHEVEHVRAGDTGWLCVSFLMLAAMPWNPVIWWQVGRLRRAIELDCDVRVLRRGADPREYARVLFAIGLRKGSMSLPSAAMSQSASLLEERVRRILPVPGGARGSWSITASIMATGCLLLAFAVPRPAVSLSSGEIPAFATSYRSAGAIDPGHFGGREGTVSAKASPAWPTLDIPALVAEPSVPSTKNIAYSRPLGASDEIEIGNPDQPLQDMRSAIELWIVCIDPATVRQARTPIYSSFEASLAQSC